MKQDERAGGRIVVRNLQRVIPANGPALQAFAERALPLCLRRRTKRVTPLRKLARVYILLISDRRMSMLHRRFLGQTGPTDVLTFEHGEIFISVETARRHARRFGNSLQAELQLYIVHGLLHLHGFDDRRPGEARRMEVAQEKIVKAATARQGSRPRVRLV
jgi:probable rRNA maturation factor